jgi:protein-tyrosine phosphatase
VTRNNETLLELGNILPNYIRHRIKMYEVIPGLYLASFIQARELALDSHYVFMNCTKDLPMLGPGVRIPVNDDLRPESIQTLYSAFPDAVKWIDSKIKKGNMVVVHCAAGQQRSAAVLAAWLMWKFGYSVDMAVEYLRSVKPDAFLTGVNFRPALEQWSSTGARAPRMNRS